MKFLNSHKYLKWITFISVAVILIGAAAYLGVSYIIYDTLSKVTPGGGVNGAYTPDSFRPYKEWPNFDTTPYLMPDYEKVHFPSRQAGLNLVGWYVPGEPGAPVVLVTHGFDGCKCDPNVLTAAGMLHRNGFNVLLYDMREHGESDIEDGRASIGNEEYLDLLGAWDWLVAEKHFTPDQIGLYGVSMGAGTTLIAFSQEPSLAAVFVDSPFSDLSQIIREELANKHYPTFFAPGGIFMARVIAGDDLLQYSPQDAIRKDAGRPIFIVHGTGDLRINVRHTYQLQALAQQTGANLQTWIPEGVAHVAAEFDFPVEYEQRLVTFFRQALRQP